MTYKSDGKSKTSSSSSEPISEKFTQRPTDEDTVYEEHDIKDTHDYKKNQLGPREYFVFGFIIVFLLFLASLASNTKTYVEYERDRTLAKQSREAKREKSPFDEA